MNGSVVAQETTLETPKTWTIAAKRQALRKLMSHDMREGPKTLNMLVGLLKSVDNML